ncbi:MAG: hypothetical protein WD401_02445 [Thermomicrobiaceae bacterium]
MAEEYSSGGSDLIEGGSVRAVDELGADAFMSMPPTPARPSWMVTRYPVPMEEFERLNEEADNPQAGDPAALEAEEDQTTIDEDITSFSAVIDVPEGETAAGPIVAAPLTTRSFEGIPQTAWMPPDNTIAVGPNDVMVAVNTDLAGYTKLGALRFRWANMTTLFSAVLPAGASLFDPQLAYDHYEQRWIVVIDAPRESPAGSWIKVGVSQSPNPAGAYWVWALDATLDGNSRTDNWADYSQLGFDTQAIYITQNMFQFNGGFQYTKLRILNKSELYSGGNGPNHFISWYDLWNLRNPDNSFAFTVQPAKHFRGLGGNPPAYFVNAIWPEGNALTLWTLSNPIGFWTGLPTSLNRRSVNCRAYSLPPDAEQSGSTTRVATNDSRLLNAVFQFVGTTQSLWTCHTSNHTWSGERQARSILQWYEIDVQTGSTTQQNGYGARGMYYYFPAIQTDISRNAYLVFSRSSSTQFAQLRHTGRRVGDTTHVLQNSALIKSGEGAYTSGRWGDYFGICRDGGDSSTVWMYGEYADTGNTWGTWIAATRF